MSYIQIFSIGSDVDIQELLVLLSGRTCAELERVINDAGISAAYSGRDKINRKDMFDACVRLITGEPDNIDPCTGKSAKLVAIHEAGHVVVSEYWKRGSVNLVSIAGTSCRKSGVTSFIKDDEKAHSAEDLIAEVSVALAGKAATKVLLGYEDMGCRDDIREAYKMLKSTVADLCWFSFNTITQRADASELNKDNRDDAICFYLESIYKTTTEIISDNQVLVSKIAESLTDYTSISYKDIYRIIDEVGWNSGHSEKMIRDNRYQYVMDSQKEKVRIRIRNHHRIV